MYYIDAWYLQGIDYREAPSSLEELRGRARKTSASTEELLATAKWEHLLQGNRADLPAGWTHLSNLADTRRGIATGANGFFLLSKTTTAELRIRETSILPCVGRALDVAHVVFRTSDFNEITAKGAKTQLLNLRDPLSAAEAAYIAVGESQGLRSRYLLANRQPWYLMEQREIASIWASVFGRGDLKFVHNAAGVRSLTNFHCVYPIERSINFSKALTFCLNMPTVREGSRLHTRVYGGGLHKFEPNDLKHIAVPDLRMVSKSTIARLAEALDLLDDISRGRKKDDVFTKGDLLVREAGEEAGKSINYS